MEELLAKMERVQKLVYFFFQAEDGIRDLTVTGVQTCALPIFADAVLDSYWADAPRQRDLLRDGGPGREVIIGGGFHAAVYAATRVLAGFPKPQIGRASCRERV